MTPLFKPGFGRPPQPDFPDQRLNLVCATDLDQVLSHAGDDAGTKGLNHGVTISGAN